MVVSQALSALSMQVWPILVCASLDGASQEEMNKLSSYLYAFASSLHFTPPKRACLTSNSCSVLKRGPAAKQRQLLGGNNWSLNEAAGGGRGRRGAKVG